MAGSLNTPRVLIVTPEVTYLPPGMGKLSNYIGAKAGGLADVSASLISTLFKQGVDVHIALPDYRNIFHRNMPPNTRKVLNTTKNSIPTDRIHLAQDRRFFYLDHITYGGGFENTKIALTFQREIINSIVPRVQPDLIHCNDWVTGLIPPMAKRLGIPCLFTIHNIHTTKCPLSLIEDIGIDAAPCWQNLFFDRFPLSYQESRDSNGVDFLASGIFAAQCVNTVSPTFLMEMTECRHDWMEEHLRHALAAKRDAGCAFAILNAPDASFNPTIDKTLFRRYGARNHYVAKQHNKLFLQERLGLIMDAKAPVLFWPSRLDRVQKGCQVFADILYDLISIYREQNLEIVFVANGEFKRQFKDIVAFHRLNKHVAVCDFEERLSRQAYGASDFIIMPSRFEPCGLPRMIGPLYGALPVVHDTGGLHDTVIHMDVDEDKGTGFIFKDCDANGLFWGVKEAMRFYNLSQKVKNRQIERIMKQSETTFKQAVTASQYIELYENMLQSPLATQ